jgi:hypothetical protein
MNLLKKLSLKRKWDENIWKLIVFAITIVIAIGVVSLVSYFYLQSKGDAVVNAVLNSPSSSPEELYKVWLCASPAEGSKVEVDAIEWTVYLTCPSGFGPNA